MNSFWTGVAAGAAEDAAVLIEGKKWLKRTL
jgi:hypothetical protein